MSDTIGSSSSQFPQANTPVILSPKKRTQTSSEMEENSKKAKKQRVEDATKPLLDSENSINVGNQKAPSQPVRALTSRPIIKVKHTLKNKTSDPKTTQEKTELLTHATLSATLQKPQPKPQSTEEIFAELNTIHSLLPHKLKAEITSLKTQLSAQTSLVTPQELQKKTVDLLNTCRAHIIKKITADGKALEAAGLLPPGVSTKFRAFLADVNSSSVILAELKRTFDDIFEIQTQKLRDALKNNSLETLFASQTKEIFAKSVQMALKAGLPRELHLFLRAFLDNKYPNQQLHKYSDDYSERFTLPPGMKTMVEYTRQQNPSLLPLKIFNTTTEMKENLSAILKDPKTKLPTVFIYRCETRFGPLSFHMSTFLVDNDEKGNPCFFISDSLGQNGIWYFWLAQFLQKEFPASMGVGVPIPRQKDKSNCALFCLHDAIIMSKNHAQIKKNISQLKETSVDTYARRDLKMPLALLFPTQSLKDIERFQNDTALIETTAQEKLEFTEKLQKYIGDAPQPEEPKRRSLPPGIEDEVASNTETTKKQNFFIERQSSKFEGLLWRQIILETQLK